MICRMLFICALSVCVSGVAMAQDPPPLDPFGGFGDSSDDRPPDDVVGVESVASGSPVTIPRLISVEGAVIAAGESVSVVVAVALAVALLLVVAWATLMHSKKSQGC